MISMDHMASSWSSSTTPTRPAAMSEYYTSSCGSACWGSPPAPAKTTKVFSVMAMSAPLLYVSLLHVPPYSSLLGDTKFWFLVSNAIILVLAAELYSSRVFDDAAACDAAAPAPDGAYDDVEEYYAKHYSRWRRSCGDSVCGPVQAAPSRSPVPEDEEEPPMAMQLVPVAGVAGDHHKEEEEAGSSKAVGRRTQRSESELGGADRRGHGAGSAHSTSSKVVPLLRKSKTEKMSRALVVPPEETQLESEYLTMSDEELNRRVEEFIRKFNMEIRRQHSTVDRRDHI